MNKTLSTTLTVLAVLALAAVIFFGGSMYARMNTFGPSMMYGRGPSMMGGYGNNNTNGYGPGGMMGNYGNMMNGYNNANVTPLTIDQTKAAAEEYLANLDNSDFEIAEIMIFDNNGYVIVKEISTGVGAFELLVDPASQVAYPEHGPNMMWNLKYSGLNHQYMMGNGGMMSGGGMMGYGNIIMQGWDNTTPRDVSASMSVTPEQAEEYAQQYLDANIAGATVEHPMPFYGYYTLDFEKDGTMAGMLSINGYNGQVFLHTWHGTFIEEVEFE
ncbi:MAG: hypothetical protein DCC56_01840 [Anaerolineae bacterium]|nr:MAG: hypothetical protein DCC56_01840 [Anaerolineae bacterium]WKZ44779.1 MAG: hypothetical protein QY302_03185 [Anaerolineales bacterium]